MMIVSDLKCEYITNPLGIDIQQPRFSWNISSELREVSQSAYHIIVADSPEKLRKKHGNIWDSGKVCSDQSTNIVFQGVPLQSAEKYYWNVSVWNQNEELCSMSETQYFRTGLLNKSDWDAQWITATDTSVSAPLFRKEFEVEKKIRNAYVYVTGLGYYELYLNGEKVGFNVLDPGRTEYQKRILYSTFDVTEQLKKGLNVAGIITDNGAYRLLGYSADLSVKDRWTPYGWNRRETLINTSCAIMQLHITYMDGSSSRITTDKSWKFSDSPITFNHILGGEDYDARLEKPGWSSIGFDMSDWHEVAVVSIPGVILQSQLIPPMKVIKTIHPVAKTGAFLHAIMITGWGSLHYKVGGVDKDSGAYTLDGGYQVGLPLNLFRGIYGACAGWLRRQRCGVYDR